MPASDNREHEAESGEAGAPGAADRAPSAAAIYARLLPLLVLGLVLWLIVSDTVLEHRSHGANPILVAWGLRTVRSRTGSDDPDDLVRTYGEASERIAEHLARSGDAPAPDPQARKEAVAVQSAYDALGFWGAGTMAILGIACLLFCLAGLKGDVSVAARAKTHLIACGIVLVGLIWFRWSFARVSDALAYAREGTYGYTGLALAVLVGVLVTALVSGFLWAVARGARPLSPTA